MNGGTEQASLPNQQLSQEHSDGASSSKDSDAKKLASGKIKMFLGYKTSHVLWS